jgi:cytochrome c-type biogenesis protein
MNTSITFAIAFSAGLASFLSPCVLPLVPIYLAQLVGPSVIQSTEQRTLSMRLYTFLHALLFVLGFSLMFIALGATASMLGHFLKSNQLLFRQVGGVILVLLGIHLAGLWRLPFLYREARFHYRISRPSFPASFLMGVVFSIGWTPCVGVILSGILILAGASQTLQTGVVLLAAYSLGLGVPFLAMGLAANLVSGWLKRLKPHLGKIEIATGLLLVVVGVAMFLGLINYLPQYFNFSPVSG